MRRRRRLLSILVASTVLTFAVALLAAFLPWQGMRTTRAFVHLERLDHERLAVVDRVTWWWGKATIVDTEATILSGHVLWNPQDPLRVAQFAPEFHQLGSDPAGWLAPTIATAPALPTASAWRREAFGFPFAALGQVWCETQSGAIHLEGGIDLRTPPVGATVALRGIPLTPIWAGLLPNILAYAAVLVAGAAIVRRAVRWRRRRAGRCPTCAYPLHGVDRCPECGSSAG